MRKVRTAKDIAQATLQEIYKNLIKNNMKNKKQMGFAEIIVISVMFGSILLALAYQMKNPCKEAELGERICLVYTPDHAE